MSTREYDSRLVSDSRLPFDPTDDRTGALLRNMTRPIFTTYVPDTDVYRYAPIGHILSPSVPPATWPVASVSRDRLYEAFTRGDISRQVLRQLLLNETVEQSVASLREIDLEPAYNLAAQGAYDG